MKLKTVQSKYKNPDRFIESLKKEIAFIEGCWGNDGVSLERKIKELEEASPKYVAHWSKPAKHILDSTTVNGGLSDYKVGDNLIYEGAVQGVYNDKKGTRVEVHFKTMYRGNPIK